MFKKRKVKGTGTKMFSIDCTLVKNQMTKMEWYKYDSVVDVQLSLYSVVPSSTNSCV